MVRESAITSGILGSSIGATSISALGALSPAYTTPGNSK
jgi:hypothetical protein